MNKQQTMTVRVSGAGNSKQKAFVAALAKVQKEVLQNCQSIILRIEPADVAVVSAYEEISIEKFLFFFLPRKKEFYEITLDVTVDVILVEIDKIKFVSKTNQ